MRRLILLPALLVTAVGLSACGSGTSEPAASAPAAQAPAVGAPAVEAAPQTAAADADVAPLFGSWAATLSACGAPIVISATRFEGAENSCSIDSLADNGDGSFTASLTCNSQGQTSAEKLAMTPIFGPQGEGIRLSYVDRAGASPVTVFRC